MTVVNPDLMIFLVNMNRAVTDVIENADPVFLEMFGPIGVTIHTTDGLTAKFFEDGIDIYPQREV